MRPMAILAMFALLPALAGVSCGGEDAPAAAPKSPAEVIRGTERARIRALVSGDEQRAEPLHADDFVLTTPGGDTLTKRRYLDLVGSGRLDYVTWEPISAIRVTVSGDKADVRYRSRIGFAGNFGGTTEQTHTDTYERRAGRWMIVRSVTVGD